LTDSVLAGELSSNDVTVIVIVGVSNKLPWQLRSGARNQFNDRNNCNTYIENHRATITDFSSTTPFERIT
jgi:hypothetical protein